jgi:hypothetical protein
MVGILLSCTKLDFSATLRENISQSSVPRIVPKKTAAEPLAIPLTRNIIYNTENDRFKVDGLVKNPKSAPGNRYAP